MAARVFVLAAMLAVGGAEGVRAQEAGGKDGQVVFNNACRTCHTTKQGDNRLGPNLAGIVGRKAGSVDGYEFSSALKGADFVWDEAKLDQFIANPEAVAPGNNMKPYSGIENAEDRKKIIEFLKTASAS